MFVVKVYTDNYGVLCLFNVIEFSEEKNATAYANEMLEKGFGVEVYQRISF